MGGLVLGMGKGNDIIIEQYKNKGTLRKLKTFTPRRKTRSQA